MMNIEIKRWDKDEIIIAGEYESVRDALQRCAGKSFYRADLCGANLRDANLRDANLCGANLRDANLCDANLCGANLRDANLCDANLCGANLRDANLCGANLRGANLCDANLRGANLRGANLCGAKNNDFLFLPDLYLLKMQPKGTLLRGWKFLHDGKTTYQSASYEVGKTYKFDDIDRDEKQECGRGGNLGTLTWCLKNSSTLVEKGLEFIECEFKAEDLVMPYATDGKFRVKEFTVIRSMSKKEVLKMLKEITGE